MRTKRASCTFPVPTMVLSNFQVQRLIYALPAGLSPANTLSRLVTLLGQDGVRFHPYLVTTGNNNEGSRRPSMECLGQGFSRFCGRSLTVLCCLAVANRLGYIGVCECCASNPGLPRLNLMSCRQFCCSCTIDPKGAFVERSCLNPSI